MNPIDVPDQSHPWSTVIAVAKHFDPDEWLLTGGLMVQVHSMLHDLPVRPTHDADFLLNILTYDRIATQMRNFLGTLGFALEEDSMTGYATRFSTKSDNQVDLMVTDYLYGRQKRENATLDGKKLCGMPGGGQAIKRSQLVQIKHQSEVLTITVPDLLGAIMLKSAAWSVDKTSHRSRHLEDAALLLSLIDDPQEQIKRLHSVNDRKRIEVLYKELTDSTLAHYWQELDRNLRDIGTTALYDFHAWAQSKES
ncbi:hypothetical protein [Bifidobacterium callitrichidarum]|uniref:Nucleotidyl transferase AbiEii/AbiGii toxin family protein n=1 Tax=Bifidobacterium callitrichidarum TaxID=2052941 RepID=A0A2U2NCC7_9BIFI|nr:hypothetical protein [Bifidobacterium callitrichidarum]PWG66772.1 hypothetical protein DF196_02395 [Bifidobacterium callitrichidarum]